MPNQDKNTKPNKDTKETNPLAVSTLSQGKPTESNAIKIPKIELPKGGGAIKSIDEKFEVNAVNGSASLSIPLPFSPGRNGQAPQLALSYNSGGGNSEFGLGWNVGVPAIQRKTEQELPRYRDYEESDTFILAGAEDLVPELELVSGEWKPLVIIQGDKKIKRYRPRIEGLFSRIEKIEDNGNVYWSVRSRDNVVSVFGESKIARISNPNDDNQIFKWSLEYSYDDKGHFIRYIYKKEDKSNLPLLVSEKNRLNDVAPFTNLYLKRVLYGNRIVFYQGDLLPINVNDFLFELVLDYGEHDDDKPTPDEAKPWTTRKDPFSNHRSGFDIRTYRRCHRVLMFHRFDELSPNPYLVRSLDLEFDETVHFTFLESTTQSGYIWNADGSLSKKESMPPMKFNYAKNPFNHDVKEISKDNLHSWPVGLADNQYQWIDLHSEGLSGILYEQGSGWYYSSNLGDGHFSNSVLVTPKPSYKGMNDGNLSIQELEGNGVKYLVQSGRNGGYFELNPCDGWRSFNTFDQYPNLDFNNPNIKMIDVNGDGLPDLLISMENEFLWYASKGRIGYDDYEVAMKSLLEENGPQVLFSDSNERLIVTTMDMSGDGLADIVLIQNNSVCYYPNLGYGRFGAKISMAMEGSFDYEDHFNPDYLQFADIDGSGTTDIIYLAKNKIQIWYNESGNSLSKADEFYNPFPNIDSASKISVIDLLGNGTTCIVWSSALPAYSETPVRYIDITKGQKPHIMTGYYNNMGKVVSIQYKPSTHYYLQDKIEGKQWVSKLPFPVQCIDKIIIEDRVSQWRFTNQYRYHHGYYDGVEREFRGFAMVEQTDTEVFDQYKAETIGANAVNVIREDLYQPAVITKSWFHTGHYWCREKFIHQLREEYFSYNVSPGSVGVNYILEDGQIPADITAYELSECYRGLKGLPLRQEIYSDEGDDVIKKYPYAITQFNYNIQKIQSKEKQKHAIFLTTEKEKISFALERNPVDPRISHNINVEIDTYGNILQAASIVYGRKIADTNLPSDKDRQKQSQRNILYSKYRFTEKINTTDLYRLPVVCEAQTYELKTGNPINDFYTTDEILLAFANAAEKTYEQICGNNEKRQIELVRTLYLKDNLQGAMPFGKMDSRGLPYQNYMLAFIPTMVNPIYGTKVDDIMLRNAGKYVRFEGDDNYWIRSGITHFHPDLNIDIDINFVPPATSADVDYAKSNFFLPVVFEDQLGYLSKIIYDNYKLFMSKSRDALGNEINVLQFHYRTLMPWLISDPNSNRSGIRVNALGLPTKAFVLGKSTQQQGDYIELSAVEEHTNDKPSVLMKYECDRYQNSNPTNLSPSDPSYPVIDANRVFSKAYENHHFDENGSVQSQNKSQKSYAYSDGSGNVVLQKVNAEPGIVKKIDDSGNKIEINATNRWVGSGITLLNNKGNPVKQYEPFFDDNPDYTNEKSLVCQGYSPILHYDALSRVFLSESPNGTFTKVLFDAWSQTHFDANDTVLESKWYAEKTALPQSDPLHKAAKKTEIHANTPSTAHLDTLGRIYLTIDHNKGQRSNEASPFEVFHETRVEYDIESNPIKVIDARGNVVMSWKYDMLGHQVYQYSMDGGERWMLPDAMLREIRKWDSRGHMTAHFYDELHRPSYSKMYDATTDITYERYIYGESLTNADQTNHRGQLYQMYDTAGKIEVETYDFKGNSLQSERRLCINYKDIPNWPVTNMDALLQARSFVTQNQYDALNRPVKTITPDSSIHTPSYNEGGMLEQVKVRIKGQGSTKTFVKNIDYNAKGQRELIEYGNNTKTSYSYEAETYRLQKLVSKKGNQFLQDLSYTYDPAGNITEIYDNAQKTIFYAGQKIEQRNEYTYDAIYQLIEATGREHTGQVSHGPNDNWDDSWCRINHAPSDVMNMRNYTQKYQYDSVGNIMQLRHQTMIGNGNWNRNYQYETINNHLLRTTVGNGSTHNYAYDYNVHGSIMQLSHMANPIKWNFREEMQAVDMSNSLKAWYVYDAQGQRVRKIIEKDGGAIEERLFLDGVEVYQERDASNLVQLERETVHVQDDAGRIVMVDTLIIEDGVSINVLIPLIKYIFSNHLSTATLEADENGDIISYEEYHPFGTSSYQAVNASIQTTSKRYKYTGKERDDETGLYYHGARYYLCWLGRWLSADPGGLIDGINLFNYVSSNPIKFNDPNGNFKSDNVIFNVTISPNFIADKNLTGNSEVDKKLINLYQKFSSNSGTNFRVSTGDFKGHTYYQIDIFDSVGSQNYLGGETIFLSNSKKEYEDSEKMDILSNEKINKYENAREITKDIKETSDQVGEIYENLGNLANNINAPVETIKSLSKLIEGGQSSIHKYSYHATRKVKNLTKTGIKPNKVANKIVKVFNKLPLVLKELSNDNPFTKTITKLSPLKIIGAAVTVHKIMRGNAEFVDWVELGISAITVTSPMGMVFGLALTWAFNNQSFKNNVNNFGKRTQEMLRIPSYRIEKFNSIFRL